jgi:hypothetical protein
MLSPGMKSDFIRRITLVVIALIYFSELTSQIPEIEWQYSYGGTSWDEARNVNATADGGVIVTGMTICDDGDVLENHGLFDYWLIKLNVGGSIEWQKSYGGSGYDFCYDAKVTSDGGYILAGHSASTDGDITETHGGDYWIVKTDMVGNIEWEKCYGGSSTDYAESVYETTDGGYIVAGRSSSSDGDVTGHHGGTLPDYWIIKLNSTGTLLWEKSYGSFDIDAAKSVIETSDGGFAISGYISSNGGDVTGSHGLSDFWVIKLDSIGELLWQKTFGGSETDIAYDILESVDNNLLVIGETYSSDGDITDAHAGIKDCWIIKLDLLGSVIWKKCYGGSGGEEGKSIIQDIDGNYVFSANASSSNGDLTLNNGANDFWAVKIDSNGEIIWQKSLGGSNEDLIPNIVQTSDNNYVMAGFSQSSDFDLTENNGDFDYWVVKLSTCNELYYADNDGDGFGDLLNDSMACNLPVGYVSDSSDCNDTNELIFPTAIDLCNSIDDNCNGLIDEDAIFTTWYSDADGDNFGDMFNDSISCFDLLEYVIDNTDCNDLNAEINPAAVEICNSIDDNCNTLIDEGLTIYTFYVDADGDFFGNSDIFIYSCLEIIAGYVLDSTDCDDSNNLIYPGTTEICDYLDNDCDGIIDDNLSYIHSYEDSDSDNYGNPEVDSLSCELPIGFVEDDSDCDDTNPLIYPGADEILNGIDDDCNELIDEGLSLEETDLNAIVIYPNPTDNILYINWPNSEQGTFQLINISGEIIKSFNKIYPFNILDVSKYASGVYFLKINSAEIVTEIKFIKE